MLVARSGRPGAHRRALLRGSLSEMWTTLVIARDVVRKQCGVSTAATDLTLHFAWRKFCNHEMGACRQTAPLRACLLLDCLTRAASRTQSIGAGWRWARSRAWATWCWMAMSLRHGGHLDTAWCAATPAAAAVAPARLLTALRRRWRPAPSPPHST